MKYIKLFEDYNPGWIIPIKDELLDTTIFDKISDIRDSVKEGDVVIGVYFGGNFDAYLMKLGKGDNDELGCSNDDSWYGLEHAWGIFDPKDYNSYAEQSIELTMTANKYNL